MTEAETIALRRENYELRVMLCTSNSRLPYLDDGELQDSERLPFIDYRRDTPDEIRQKWIERCMRPSEHEPNQGQWRHLKSGGVYTLLAGIGHVQTDEPMADMTNVAIYRGDDGRLWARRLSEFLHRFEPVKTDPQGDGS